MAKQGERLKAFCEANDISTAGGKMFVSFRETGTVACEVTVQGEGISTNHPPDELLRLARNNVSQIPWVRRLVASQASDFEALLRSPKADWNGHQLARLFWVAYAPSLLAGAENRQKLQFQWGQDLFVSKDASSWRNLMRAGDTPVSDEAPRGRGLFRLFQFDGTDGIEFTSEPFEHTHRRSEALQRLITVAIQAGAQSGVIHFLTGPNSAPTKGMQFSALPPERWTTAELTDCAKKNGGNATSTHRLFITFQGFTKPDYDNLIGRYYGAKVDAPETPWSRLAAFAFQSGWTSRLPERLCCNVILEGVPGTGKTHALKELAAQMGNSKTIADGRFATVMHPATSYEDFVEGLRPGKPGEYPKENELKAVALKLPGKDVEPKLPGGNEAASEAGARAPAKWFFEPPTEGSSGFCIHDGFFVAACAEAVRNPNKPYVVLLDELNRCNIPKVMGDLITTMEVSKRAKWIDKQWDLSSAQVVTLPYSKRLFFVPDNLTIVGTMNTTDRSVAPMDAALRRRFVFVRVEPQLYHERLVHPAITAPRGARWRLAHLNDALAKYLGPDAALGHSYLFDLQVELKSAKSEQDDDVVKFCFRSVIFPMVIDTLSNHGCIAELAVPQTKEAKEFRTKLEEIATVEPAGRGITQTLKLTWKDAPASPPAKPANDGTREN